MWGCGWREGNLEEGTSASICAYSGVLSKLAFLYGAIKLSVMVSPDHLPTPTQEESNLWLCTGEHLPSGILCRPWQQFSWSEEKTVYPALKNVLLPTGSSLLFVINPEMYA